MDSDTELIEFMIMKIIWSTSEELMMGQETIFRRDLWRLLVKTMH